MGLNIKDKVKQSEALSQSIDNVSEQQRKIINDNISISLNDLQDMIENHISKPMQEMSDTFNEAMKIINDMASIKLNVSASDIERAEVKLNGICQEIKNKELKLNDLEKKADRVQSKANKMTLKIALINILVCCLTLGVGFFWATNKQKEEIGNYYDQLEEELKTSIDIWYANADKRMEIQSSATAYDEYLEYCINQYVSCPIFTSCDKAKEIYIEEFENRFGSRPAE